MTTPQAAAERVLADLVIHNVEDLRAIEDIAWARGADVEEAKLTGAEARVVIRGDRGIITVSSDCTDARRRRFSIAHELGHFEMHKHRSSLSVCLSDDIEGWKGTERTGKDALEMEADVFASCLLLPERWFAAECRTGTPSLDIVAHLADRYTTSLTATARRYTEFCDESVAIVYSRDGMVRWFCASSDFREAGYFVEPKTRLSGQTLAGGYFKGTPPPAAARPVLAENWLNLRKANPLATIIEQSRAMPTYNAVLSLLWVKDDLVDDDEYDLDDD